MVPEPVTTQPRRYATYWTLPPAQLWRPIVGAILGVIAFVVVTFVFAIAAIIAAPANSQGRAAAMTPELFLANNLSLAACIVFGLALSRWPMRHQMGFISSVVGKIRWRWLLTCVAIVLPVWIVSTGVNLALAWESLELSFRPHTVAMIVIVATTQVLQSAGEEYGFRGVLNRAFGAFFGSDVLALIVGAVASSLLFVFVHGAEDRWLNLYYFCFGMVACWLTYKTGGLEAAIAIHCVNNVLALSLAPFQDLDTLFDRHAGVADATILIDIAIMVVVALVLAALAKRRAIVVATVPQRVTSTSGAAIEGPMHKFD